MILKLTVNSRIGIFYLFLFRANLTKERYDWMCLCSRRLDVLMFQEIGCAYVSGDWMCLSSRRLDVLMFQEIGCA